MDIEINNNHPNNFCFFKVFVVSKGKQYDKPVVKWVLNNKLCYWAVVRSGNIGCLRPVKDVSKVNEGIKKVERIS